MKNESLISTVICLGIATIFISENFVPATHFLVGKILRYCLAAAMLTITIWKLPTIYKTLGKMEKTILALVLLAGILAICNSFILGRTPDMFYFTKIILFNISIYLLAKLIFSEEAIHTFFRMIYYMCCVASVQGIITLSGDLFQLYHIGEVTAPVLTEERPIIYPFWGLSGSHNFMRSSWYFSESAFFTQMLMVGLGYAITTRRYWGIALITLGILSSFAVMGMIACVIMLIAMLILYRKEFLKPVATVLITILISYLTIGDFYNQRGREGITSRVLSVHVINQLKETRIHIRKLKNEIDELKAYLSTAPKNTDDYLAKEKRLYEIISKKEDLKTNYYGNLRNHDLDKLIEMSERGEIPTSLLPPSDDVFYRGTSGSDKIQSLEKAGEIFLKYPFGLGMIAPNNYEAVTMNMSPGLVSLSITFGLIALLFILPIYGFILKNTIVKRPNTSIDPMFVTFGGLLLATFWHGPHFHYFMIFMLAILVTVTSKKKA